VTSFHHQLEAQHQKISSYQRSAGRLPNLFGRYRVHSRHRADITQSTRFMGITRVLCARET
jgi:hypothetical protein